MCHILHCPHIASAGGGHSPAFTTVWPLLNSYCVVEQTVNGQIEQNILLSWKAFRVANTKGIETKQRQSFHCTLHWSNHVTWTHCISMRKTKPFFGQNQYLIVSVCEHLPTTNLWISSNNKHWDTESWFAYSNYWFSKGHRESLMICS